VGATRDNGEREYFMSIPAATHMTANNSNSPGDPADAAAELNAAVEDCLARLAAGDLNARSRLIELCNDRLRRIARRLIAGFPRVRRWNDTDDLLQAGGMRLFRALEAVRPTSPREVMGLAATQMHRELLDLARRYAGPTSHAANCNTNVFLDPDGGYRHHVEHHAEETTGDDSLERWNAFHDAVSALPADLREVFNLVWYAGADQATVARIAGCSVSTVKNRWRRARERVHAALDGRSPKA